jgi:hypothetical protein
MSGMADIIKSRHTECKDLESGLFPFHGLPQCIGGILAFTDTGIIGRKGCS